jgi:hypothetical protein
MALILRRPTAISKDEGCDHRGGRHSLVLQDALCVIQDEALRLGRF